MIVKKTLEQFQAKRLEFKSLDINGHKAYMIDNQLMHRVGNLLKPVKRLNINGHGVYMFNGQLLRRQGSLLEPFSHSILVKQ